jgi:putative aminopeptidase FrvX
LAVFERVIEMNLEIDLMVVFNRAEEIGLTGACGGCKIGTIPKNALVVSLEASKTLEGALPGEGVVIRTGDKLYQFDPNAQSLLDQASNFLLSSGLKTQKRRMDGGVCEASLYHASGYETTAVAIPLLNYHNHADGALAAEAVAIYDLNSGVELLVRAAQILPEFKHVSRSAFLFNTQEHFAQYEDLLLN